MQKSNAQFMELNAALTNSFMDQWKAEQKKILGFYCSTIPEELIYAAGIFPYRLRANVSQDTALADALLSRFNCSFVRNSLDLALNGQYSFMDGLVVSSSCDHIRRMYDMWIRKVETPKGYPVFFLSVPRVITDPGFEFLKEEYEMLKTGLEKEFQNQIDAESISNAINTYNENRKMLQLFQELRAGAEVKLAGSEFLNILLSNASVPKEQATIQLQKLLPEFQNREPMSDFTRLMLVGSYVDKPEFLQTFEEVGGMVVTDSLCTGVRSFCDLVKREGDPLDDLVRHYYTKLSCPRMMDQHPQRFDFVKRQVEEAAVEGVVLQRLEFCDLHGCDNMLLEKEIEAELDIPVLNIDREYLLGDIGRFKTRIEAFIEQIKVMG